jgi:hypothetical protein
MTQEHWAATKEVIHKMVHYPDGFGTMPFTEVRAANMIVACRRLKEIYRHQRREAEARGESGKVEVGHEKTWYVHSAYFIMLFAELDLERIRGEPEKILVSSSFSLQGDARFIQRVMTLIRAAWGLHARGTGLSADFRAESILRLKQCMCLSTTEKERAEISQLACYSY